MKISFQSDPPFPSTLLSDDSLGASGITEHQSPYVDNKVERCLVEGESGTRLPCTVCGGATEKFQVTAEAETKHGTVRVCARCLEVGDLDNRLERLASEAGGEDRRNTRSENE